MLENISAAVNEQFPLDSVLELLLRKMALRCIRLSGPSPVFLMRQFSHVPNPLLIVSGHFEKAAALAPDFENLRIFVVSHFPPSRNKPYESGKMDGLHAM